MKIVEQIEKEFEIKFLKLWGKVVGFHIDLCNDYQISVLYSEKCYINCTKDTVEVGVVYKGEYVIGIYPNVDLKRLKEIVEEVKKMSELEEDK